MPDPAPLPPTNCPFCGYALPADVMAVTCEHCGRVLKPAKKRKSSPAKPAAQSPPAETPAPRVESTFFEAPFVQEPITAPTLEHEASAPPLDAPPPLVTADEALEARARLRKKVRTVVAVSSAIILLLVYLVLLTFTKDPR
ncbi:hypothetical protein [Aeoliella mucimassa]|uniref:Uncharacterized protein n=1 Tax=Aeoliella mucimassa TaxID=2527972 RepID=A0A518AUA9_9BACT|nr:hypothetical protein [Aeoliella mucimassa]QDU58318.1 hypothetical protein Pan181_45510 [Aeoliella mucimassa]